MMEKNTLTPTLLRLLEFEEELIDFGAKTQFSQKFANTENSTEGIGRILCSVIDEMPSIPVYAGTLVWAVNNNESTSSLISKIISEDPSLAALILKNVNSPYYKFPNKIVDLQHAITLLGNKQIHLLVLYHGMRNTLPNTRSFVNLQSQSVLLSYLTSAVGELIDSKKVPLLSTLGLLSRIGNGVIYLAQHKHPEIEEAAPLLNHFKIGSMLLIRWNLPEIIYETIRLMGKAKYAPLEEIPESYRKSVSILTLAHAVLDQKSYGRSDVSAYLEEYVDHAGFGGMSIDHLADTHILPLLRERKNVLPHVVRNFLNTCPQKNISIGKPGIGVHEKRALKRKEIKEGGGAKEHAESSSIAGPATSVWIQSNDQSCFSKISRAHQSSREMIK
jgi:HD-like signal output (HDOD) protein